MQRPFAAETVILAQLNANSGIHLQGVILSIIGTFLIALMAIRSFSAYAENNYGKIVTSVLAAVPIAGFCYFPDQTMGIIKGLWTAVVG